MVLRSKTPDGVIQEVYGHLCVHYAIRTLMHTAANESGYDPDRLSFTRSLRAARRTTASHPGFPLEPRMMRTAASPRRSFTNVYLLDVPAPTPAWSNARCPSSTSSTRIIGPELAHFVSA